MTRQAKTDPLRPARSDYRIIKKILDSSYKVVHLPEEYDFIVTIFQKAGGSWEGVFDGGIKDLYLLKRIIKLAYKQEYITHAPTWD